ncbi:MAG: c-type cytochrome [bacterium]
MKTGFLKVSIFATAIILFFVYITDLLTQISGGGGAGGGGATGVNPEAGEAVFWGKGKCFTCHSIGSRGSAIRCPNLGDSDLGPMIGLRAGERAAERAAATGKNMSATDYLVESIATPGAYVVKGYKNEMPLVYMPPISLSADEIKAVITYLQSQGDEPDPGAIALPARVLAAASTAPEPFKPYIAGDWQAGRHWFYDVTGPAGCVRCHTAIDENGQETGGTVGPALTMIAATRSPQYILESILSPSKVIASGYESELVITRKGTYLAGLAKSEDDETLMLVTSLPETLYVKKADIDRRVPQPVSVMPGNFAELLSVQVLHDILAYLLTLKGEALSAQR